MKGKGSFTCLILPALPTLKTAKKKRRYKLGIHTIEGVKPKSVNLALETVLRFDKENHDADVEVIKKVQKFLDTVKNVMTNHNRSRRSSTGSRDLKLTDFIRESARILKTYNDKDLEDVFAVVDNELRKYHYRGCKFYELVQNHDVRRFMSDQLEHVKATPATTLRKYLDKVATTIEKDDFKGKDRFVVNLLNSLYSGTSNIFSRTIRGLRMYRARPSDTVLNDIIATTLRSLLFDHYSNLNDNARSQVKTIIQNYWISSDGNKDYRSIEHGDKKYPGLKVIEVNKFQNKDYVTLHRYPTPTPISYKELQGYKEQSQAKTKMGQKRFKITGVVKAATMQAVSKSPEHSYTNTDSNSRQRHKKKNKRTKNKEKGEKDHKKIKINPAPKTISMEYDIFLSSKDLNKLTVNTDHSKILSNKRHKDLRVSTPKEILDKTESDSFEISITNVKHVREGEDDDVKDKIRSGDTRSTTISKSVENDPKDTFEVDKIKMKKKATISTRRTTISKSVENYPIDTFEVDKIKMKKKATISTRSTTISKSVENDPIDTFEVDKIKMKKKATISTRSTTISKSVENDPIDTFEVDKRKKKKKATVSKIRSDVTSYYGHAIKSVEDILTDDSQNSVDNEKGGQPVENNLSVENVIKENAEVDPNSIGLLVGGQKIQNMNYRAKKFEKVIQNVRKRDKIRERKGKVSVNPEEILAEHSAVINVELPIQNWKPPKFETPSIKKKRKIRNPMKHVKPLQHHRQRKSKKPTRKPKHVKFDIAEDARKSFTNIEKDATNEGMTIESFESEDVNAVPVRKTTINHYKKTINNESSMKMESLFNKLEVQLKNVQRQIELLQNNEDNQPVKVVVKDNRHAHFRGVETSNEGTIETTTKRVSSTTVTPVRTTTELKTTTPVIVSTTTTPIITENHNTPTSTASVTTTASTTTSTTEPAPTFRSEDYVETTSNNVSVEKTTGTKVTSRLTTRGNINETDSITSKEVETTDDLSTTEKSNLSTKKTKKGKTSLKSYQLNPENEMNATKSPTVKETKKVTEIHESLKGLREHVRSVTSDPSYLNELTAKPLSDMLLDDTLPQNSIENANTTNKSLANAKSDEMKKELTSSAGTTDNPQALNNLDDPLKSFDENLDI